MKTNYLILTSMLLFSLTLTSCDDVGIVPDGNTVSGQIIYGGSPMSFKVMSGDNETISDSYGRFSIEVNEFPYDLIISSTNNENLWVYDDLKSNQPYINLVTEPQFFFNNLSAFIESDISFLNSNQRVLTSFIPDNGQEKVEVNTAGNRMNIKWNESSSITGKSVLLCFTISEYGNIISFDRYYEKNLTITPGMNISDTVYESDPFIDPVESTVRGTIINPNGPFLSTRSSFRIGFPNVYNNWIWGTLSIGTSFEFVVPIGLPFEYFIEGNSYEMFAIPYSKRQIKVLPGSDNNIIELFRIQNLILPDDGDTILFNSTTFSWTGEDGEGIYELTLYGSFPLMQIFTSNTQITIPDLTKWGIHFEENIYYNWRVKKFYGASTLDEFFSKEVQFKTYEGNSKSESRTVYLY